MADHLDAFTGKPGLPLPSMDARVDITDLYAFRKPDDASKTILILNVNPLAPSLAHEFDPEAIYEIAIDADGDTATNIAFRITFSPLHVGRQWASVRRATGDAARHRGDGGTPIVEHAPVSFGATAQVTDAGAYRFFAGLRSDPFFLDLTGFLHDFRFTGADFFEDKNVFGIVLEVPTTDLGTTSQLGIWARVVIRSHGKLLQLDRMGRPNTNAVFNHGEYKNTFNQIEPAHDRALFLGKFTAALQQIGRYDRAAAERLALALLPDMLPYDPSRPTAFPNGRGLADDVVDFTLKLVTNGRLSTDLVGPHTDYLPHFPFLGTPHRIQKEG
jgi:hypothetical protein